MKSGELVFTGNHRDGDIYQLRITHDGQSSITGEFNTEEVTSIVEGLADMILQQIAKKNGHGKGGEIGG